MAPCNFIFDIIVTHYEVPSVKIEDMSKLFVDAKLNGMLIRITESRFNVTEFNLAQSREFQVEPSELRSSIEQDGIPFALKYSGFNVGTATIRFPQSLSDRIEEGMSDITHCENCPLLRMGKVVGSVDILCRLLIKCDVPPQEGEGFSPGMTQDISPVDILFVMGASEPYPNPAEPCPKEELIEEGDERLLLDLKRYRTGNERVVVGKTDIIADPLESKACAELRKLTKEYESIIDTVSKKMGLKPARGAQSEPSMQAFRKLPKPQQDSAAAESPERRGEKKKILAPIADTPSQDIKPIRFCPVCLTNMSWMPKFAACPRCGLESTPLLEKRHEHILTADQVVAQTLGKPKHSIDDDFCVDPCDKEAEQKRKLEEEARSECRVGCTCKDLKLCAHCRIRKLLADIFRTIEKKPVKCPKVEPNSSEDFNVVANSSDCRPYLTRVFSELGILYDIKDQLNTQATFNKYCRLMNTTMNIREQRNERRRKMESPSDNVDEGERGHTGVKIGHKNCLTPQIVVPRRHGWAWQSSEVARKHGWRPGAIRKPIDSIMKFFQQYDANKSSPCGELDLQGKESEQPVLKVTKKNGEIYITLRALGKRKMHPIVFRVVKSDLAVAVREFKQKLKDMGFAKCTCHKSIMYCECRHYREKKAIEYALRKLCARRGMPPCMDKLVLTDTSESELDLDLRVTPPAGNAEPLLPLKPRLNNRGSQTQKKDLKPPPVVKKISPYWRAYDCAVGDRYTGTQYGQPGEVAFEDGAFGYFGGGLHGAPICPGMRSKNPKIWGAGPFGPMRGGGRCASAVNPTAIKGFPGGGRTGPYAEKRQPSEFMPVRLPERFIRTAIAKAKAAAQRLAAEKKRKPVNMMKYLEAHGVFNKKKVDKVPPRSRKLLLEALPDFGVTTNICDPCTCMPVC